MSTAFWNGNMAAAQAAKQARVQVVAAYPITPQTHTVEYLANFVADGELRARLIKVESEHSALSACAGACAVGARAFTASCSQGLALMSEVLYFTAGMRFPVVMAVANRTLSVPVNIWADHQDTLVQRDTGWLQLYASNVQEVYDLVLAAFKIAEHPEVSLPCIVSYDGFILSHASERVETLTQAAVDAFLPPPGSAARPVLDPAHPLQFGEVLFPDYYPDYELKKHNALRDSMSVITGVFDELLAISGRKLSPVEGFLLEDAELVILGIGSMMQTARLTALSLRERGERVGVLGLRAFRPFPEREVVAALGKARVVAVLDRDIGYGTSGMVYPDVTRSLYPSDVRPDVLNFIIGTGGKDITPASIERCVELARPGHRGQSVFWPDARGAPEGIPYSPNPASG
ncbi:MAG: pyruvate ferredoxin oxidoreductase [Deltaproteobacteria bacterium]|nr:pyruvate ferredoxin oxidoreductase [Deltaproteobacteria bacterium]